MFDDIIYRAADIQGTVWLFSLQPLIDQLQEDVKTVRPAVEKTRQNQTKNPDVDRLEEDVNRLRKRWESCCMQVRPVILICH